MKDCTKEFGLYLKSKNKDKSKKNIKATSVRFIHSMSNAQS